jgi:DNA-binding response OmpR family regulator
MNRKVLIAEDEEKIRKLVAGYLNREGFRRRKPVTEDRLLRCLGSVMIFPSSFWT